MKGWLVNDILKDVLNEHHYRILWISADGKNIYIFDMDSLEMPFLTQSTELMRRINDGELVVDDSDPYFHMVSEENLDDKDRSFRDNIWDIVAGIVQNEPQIFEKRNRGKLISEISERTGRDRKTFYQYLKIYWQHGKTKNAFLPNFSNCGGSGKERKANAKKRGQPRKYGENIGINADEATKTIFEKAIKKYYHTRKEYTLKDVYTLMIKEHYTKFITQPDGNIKTELISEDKIPTIRQFRYWYNKKYDVKEKISKRKGTTKFELDHRAVLGKSDYGIMGPGAKYQIDATVGDIYLVSRFNRSEIIGRPIIYFVIDVFSRMVVGMYVGLEGPSWVGSMMAIANVASDKVKYCAEYGINITEEEWPCRHLPNTILADRGEMEGYSVETLINALNVRVENAQPYRADVKGIVERFFKTINDTTVQFLPGHIKSDAAQRGGEDYRLEAKFDIRQFTEMLIHYALYHNNHNFLESYERTADMIADDVEPIPIKIWEWGIAHFGALRSFPEETVKLCLMPSDTASVTKKGIHFNGLYYVCERAVKELWFETARAKGSFKVDISYDPRNMSSIYIREGKIFEKCFLAEWQDKYVDMCFDEIKYLQAKEKLAQQKNAPKKLTEKIDFLAAIDNVIVKAEEMARQTAISKSKTARTANIRENRHNEKELNRHEESFVLGIGNTKPDIEKDESDEISPDMRMIMEDLEERLNEK